jgi:S-adenosylmethionine hydrolase
VTVRKKVNMQIDRHGNVLHDIDEESFRVVFKEYEVHCLAVGSTSHGYPHVHTY